MATPPRLRASNLVLCPFSPQHFTERYVSWLNDPEVMRLSEQRHRAHTLETCKAWATAIMQGPHYLWAIVETARGLGHIGNLVAYLDPPNALADLTILIGEAEARGRHLGLEAWQMGLTWLLGPGGIRKVTAGTMASNHPMLAVMRASGMTEDGVRRRHFLVDGREEDVVHMAVFRTPASQGELR